MRPGLRHVGAMVRRDWRIRSSSRLGLGMSVGQLVFTLASFFFIGKLVDPVRHPALAPYGGGYFAFVVLGLVGARYVTSSLASFATTLREDQLQGTLEAMLATPAGLGTIALGGVLWEWVWATVEVLLYLGLGAVLFGVELGQMNLPATLLMLLLTVLSIGSLGVLSASGILLFKDLDPVNWLLGGLMKLVGGVYFPVALLPGWLQGVAHWIPLTYALEGLRQAVLMGRSLAELQGACLVLGGFAVVLWPPALLALSWTIRRLKTTGALSFR